MWAEIERIAKRDHSGVASKAIIHMIRTFVEADRKERKK
ncbi:hypothetical protein GL4_2850 [Methyloceanibacter caenitepidi]|uniref:Uncharacterized protein n=1 Tax=Methyloceanibacter caenitepidi TaxID=1384459 RepID=A0A0A8K5R2_9HYPH|nr:hypothetical protein GL4_2850 [Methyloceanibacter caenitepidi]